MSVSVILYVHNGEAYLRTAVDAILAQTHDDFELCVVDDGSTDATASILADVAADPRVRIERQDGLGRDRLHETFNHGLAMARHDLLAVANADDIWLPHKLETQVAVFDQSPEADICWHDASFIDDRGRVKHGGFRKVPSMNRARPVRPWHFTTGNPVPNPTTVFRRSILRVIGLQETGWMHDHQFWFKAAVARCVFVGLPDRLIRYRVHEGSHSTSSIRKARIKAEHRTSAATMVARVGIHGLYAELAAANDAESRAWAWLHLGQRYWERDLVEEATDAWTMSLRCAANPATLTNLAIAAATAADHDGARRLLRQAAALGLDVPSDLLADVTRLVHDTSVLDWLGPEPPVADLVRAGAEAELEGLERVRIEPASHVVTVRDGHEDRALDQLLDAIVIGPDHLLVLTDGESATAAVAGAHAALCDHPVVGSTVAATSIDLLAVHPDQLDSVRCSHWIEGAIELGEPASDIAHSKEQRVPALV